ncbi:Cupin region [Lysobacter dokdonensis DS-58]|uniref:Cupin region n=1 Tax=Lysobacter dokdonensis DS-58 TaxID=1300345 RepID=A0A0A2WIB0_9GAMM|nr:cupin domain-containing protein [Lysobacter dokdonensis]KGQ17990.1 Cupin region [Lysobacter dokdonensis DS-58]
MKTTALFTLVLVPAFALAQTASTPGAGAEHKMVKASETQWGEGPAFLPKGVQAAVLYGDPSKAGPFAIRLKAPAGGKIPRHWHPTDEQVTIIEGDLHLSMGEAASAHDADFAPGDYVNLPAKMQHEASTKGGMVVQVNAMGPFEITYVDPKDDPRKAAAK